VPPRSRRRDRLFPFLAFVEVNVGAIESVNQSRDSLTMMMHKASLFVQVMKPDKRAASTVSSRAAPWRTEGRRRCKDTVGCCASSLVVPLLGTVIITHGGSG